MYLTALTPSRIVGAGFGRRAGRLSASAPAGGWRRVERVAGPPVARGLTRQLAGALDVLDDPLRAEVPAAFASARAPSGSSRRVRAPRASERESHGAVGRLIGLHQRRPGEVRGPGDDLGRVLSEPLLQQRAVHPPEVAGHPQVVVLRRGSPGRGIRRPFRPCALEPITKAQPAAPWSVPSEPFSSGRRPNSLHISIRTRSARPRPRGRAGRRAALRRFRAGCGPGRPPGRRGCRSRRRPGPSPLASAARRR